jgi:hypothetical protein
MTQAPDGPQPNRSGLANVLRLVAAGAIVLLAVLGVLVVFDVIPRDAFGELSTKIVLLACIVALASGAIAFLMRAGKK